MNECKLYKNKQKRQIKIKITFLFSNKQNLSITNTIIIISFIGIKLP